MHSEYALCLTYIHNETEEIDMNDDMKSCNSKKHCSNNNASSCKRTDKNTEMYFYKCEVCGQIVASTEDLVNPLSCCGEPMHILIPGTSDGAAEKHVPIYSIDGHNLIVTVGADPHPMTEEHYIEWICLVTCQGVQWHPLKPGVPPVACFRIKRDEQVMAIYEYCNIHGLWAYINEQ